MPGHVPSRRRHTIVSTRLPIASASQPRNATLRFAPAPGLVTSSRASSAASASGTRLPFAPVRLLSSHRFGENMGILPSFACECRLLKSLKALILEFWPSAPESAKTKSSCDEILKCLLQDKTALNGCFKVIILLLHLQENTSLSGHLGSPIRCEKEVLLAQSGVSVCWTRKCV